MPKRSSDAHLHRNKFLSLVNVKSHNGANIANCPSTARREWMLLCLVLSLKVRDRKLCRFFCAQKAFWNFRRSQECLSRDGALQRWRAVRSHHRARVFFRGLRMLPHAVYFGSSVLLAQTWDCTPGSQARKLYVSWQGKGCSLQNYWYEHLHLLGKPFRVFPSWQCRKAKRRIPKCSEHAECTYSVT